MSGWHGCQNAISALALAAAVALCGCGEETRYYDDEDRRAAAPGEDRTDGYAIDGDPFCEIENKLLNDADEVEEATDKEELGLVIASREGNVGVKGKPPFAPDCGAVAKKRLNKLDPEPAEERSAE